MKTKKYFYLAFVLAFVIMSVNFFSAENYGTGAYGTGAYGIGAAEPLGTGNVTENISLESGEEPEAEIEEMPEKNGEFLLDAIMFLVLGLTLFLLVILVARIKRLKRIKSRHKR